METKAGASPARGGTIRTDLTNTVFRGFVRKEESWPEDSPEYKAGCDVWNRKRPPPEEIPGDVFDRQRVICGFDQGLIERQVCLVLGTGGIGQDVALTLARLGVAKIILVDRDVYDVNNLTRQCLGGKSDIGQPKVDVAARMLRGHHSLRSEIETLHCDVVREWPKVVAAAREATVIFNGIDIGVMWDFCVNSLCKNLGLPLACGQSFGWKFMTEFYTGVDGEVCAFCQDSALSTFGASDSQVRRLGGLRERLESFRLSSNGCEPLADFGADTLAAFLAGDKQFRCSDCPRLPEFAGRALARAGLVALRPGEGLAEDMLGFLRALHDVVLEELLPDRILALPDLSFLPRPEHPDTRFVGSWVCPCLSCSVLMVSQWAAWLTKPIPEELPDGGEEGTPPGRNLPQAITFNLDTGMTTEEQLGYDLGSLGLAPNRNDRRFCQERSCETCLVCGVAATLRAEESLFFGRLPVTLSPVAGSAIQPPASWNSPVLATDPRYAVAVDRVLARRRPLAHLGEEYARAVVPAMPAVDWERGEGPCDTMGCSTASAWTSELATLPLIKVPPNSQSAKAPSVLRGVASGVRSALVRSRGRWWRLKGCGNRDQGFPIEVKGEQGELNVRGCCFEHTSETELRMTALALGALDECGLDCANKPAGSYLYEPEPHWPLPKITRYCAVFETFGNMRLGDHLLAGILLLLPHLVPVPPDTFAALRRALVEGRGADETEEPWATEMVVSCSMSTSDVAAQLVASGSVLGEEAPPMAEMWQGPIGSLPADLAPIWDTERVRLAERLASAKVAACEPSLLLWLCWRLGWECGATLRALHGAGIAWGTYPDAMGIHCNAHVNNLIVKPPGVGHPNTFLAALDFDMAFTRESFVPEAAASHAGVGLDRFEGVLEFEATMGMQTVLAGSDFTSTGVINVAAVPESHAHVEMALRDTLVTAYAAARAGSEDAHPPHALMYDAAYSLVKLALCLTTDVEG